MRALTLPQAEVELRPVARDAKPVEMRSQNHCSVTLPKQLFEYTAGILLRALSRRSHRTYVSTRRCGRAACSGLAADKSWQVSARLRGSLTSDMMCIHHICQEAKKSPHG